VEVAKKRAFFGQKWLKNVHFSEERAKKMCVFQVEVAEKLVFFRWKWLKNVRFSGGIG
jgi:hypothetical protein